MHTDQGSNSCDMVQRVEMGLSQKAGVQVQVHCLAMESSQTLGIYFCITGKNT